MRRTAVTWHDGGCWKPRGAACDDRDSGGLGPAMERGNRAGAIGHGGKAGRGGGENAGKRDKDRAQGQRRRAKNFSSSCANAFAQKETTKVSFVPSL